ncbi:hypothetical protein THASP1DRAFT_31773 [Thamnocephalis sphaerospora]|uniref:RRM domain-containing protein n=1 Tax=Thamnocephalis sphaerospora TaxID=78915 RepID=A0A4P9XKV9_9FUNG|nr:hypothetical protein THASP1DRAFT_31773 [Thamnocephalis sphaerospora]|eukprot:RKP06405.1 hypothetical protein THASP1DRAFT_31773 [Thamnocephalis sphaerospora]
MAAVDGQDGLAHDAHVWFTFGNRFGFVSYMTREDAERAMDYFKRTAVEDRYLRLDWDIGAVIRGGPRRPPPGSMGPRDFDHRPPRPPRGHDRYESRGPPRSSAPPAPGPPMGPPPSMRGSSSKDEFGRDFTGGGGDPMGGSQRPSLPAPAPGSGYLPRDN